MTIDEVTNYPVQVLLHQKSPWGESINVSKFTLSKTSPVIITNEEDLKKLKAIEKYLVIKQEGKNTPLKKRGKRKSKENTQNIENITVETVSDTNN